MKETKVRIKQAKLDSDWYQNRVAQMDALRIRIEEEFDLLPSPLASELAR